MIKKIINYNNLLEHLNNKFENKIEMAKEEAGLIKIYLTRTHAEHGRFLFHVMLEIDERDFDAAWYFGMDETPISDRDLKRIEDGVEYLLFECIEYGHPLSVEV